MENLPFSTDPATAASEAAFTQSNSSNPQADEQSLIVANSAQEGADEKPEAPVPTPVIATAINATPVAADVAIPAARGLSARQRIALQALASGMGPYQAAKAAGVSPMTVYRWRRFHARFIAAYNTWQAESMKTTQETLAAANEEAARTVLRAVRGGDVRASLALLKGTGAMALQKPGPELAELVQRNLKDETERVRSRTGLPTDMRMEKRRRHLRAKNHPELTAAEEARRAAQHARWEQAYLSIPPLARPVTQAIVDQAVRSNKTGIELFASRCTFTIRHEKRDESLRLYLAEETGRGTEEVHNCLKTLPWLTSLILPPARAESFARMLEHYGATVELRPSWVDAPSEAEMAEWVKS